MEQQRISSLMVMMDDFLMTKETEGRSESTIDFYKDKLTQWIRWMATKGIEHVEDVTPAIIRTYLAQYGETHNQGGVHSSYRAVKAFMNYQETP